MENQKKLENRKPNRNQYTAQRKAKYEKRQEEDLYELLKKERMQQGAGSKGSYSSAKPAAAKKPAVVKKAVDGTRQEKSSKQPAAKSAPPNAQTRRLQEAQAAYQSAAKTGKKINTKRNADYYITKNAHGTPEGGRKGSGRKAAGTSGTAILAMIVLFVLAIGAVAAFSIAADHNKKENTETGTKVTTTPLPTASATLSADREITAILEKKDTENMTLYLWSIEDGETLILSYSSVTDIRDKYDKQLVAGQLDIGDVLEVTYDSKQRKAATVQASKEIWELVYQSGLLIDESRNLVTLRSKSYEYTENLHVFDQGVQKQLQHLAKDDTITMRGIGTEVYVIEVERGHGYLKLSADEDYVGGNIYKENDYLAQITEGMVLQIPEGTYEFLLENKDLTATVEVAIVRNETTVLDLTEYARVPDPTCQVTFQIYPSGAVLYLNGDSTYYKNQVALPYGTYKVKVESGGYVTYEGTLEITGATMTVSISLTESGTESEDDSGYTSSETNNYTSSDDDDDDDTTWDDDTEDNTSENSSDGSYEVDDDHVIIVYSDDDVEIYLDGEYMGITEDGMAEFEKYIGSFTLELVKGTETKSYIIQVDDDGEDFEFSKYFE